MLKLIQAEVVKGRHSFGRYCMIFFPMLATVFAIFLMSGQLSQVAAFNWWYMLLLPAAIAFLTINLITSEKRMGFINLKTVPFSSQKIWLSKIVTGCVYLLFMNTVLFGFTTISGQLFGSQYPIWRGLFAGLTLTMTWAWQVPLGMWIVTKFNSATAFLGLMAANISFSHQAIAGGKLWMIPFAIPSRLMAPILGLNPNGVLLEKDSLLWDPGVIVRGMVLTMFLFFLLTWGTMKAFDWRKQYAE